MSNGDLKPGDRVTFTQTCQGGYSFMREVPAIFVKQGRYRVTIAVKMLDGSEKRIYVRPGNVRRAVEAK